MKKLMIQLLLICAALFTVGCGTAKEKSETPAETALPGVTTESEQAKEETTKEETTKEEITKEEITKEETVQEEKPAQEIAANDTEVESDAGKPDTLKGKTLTIVGDSISTYTGYIPEDYSKFYPEYGDFTGVEDTWWMQVIENTGMELCVNASYSGGTVSGDSKEAVDGRAAISDKRVGDLAGADGQAPDVIIFFVGANELLNNIALGNDTGGAAVSEGVIDTFSEAYVLMLQKVKKAYPEAELYCCTIAEVSRWNDEGERFPFTNALGLTASDYNARIEEIAKAMNIPLIDVFACGITFENAKELTLDGTHPNKEGAKLIGAKVTEDLIAG